MQHSFGILKRKKELRSLVIISNQQPALYNEKKTTGIWIKIRNNRWCSLSRQGCLPELQNTENDLSDFLHSPKNWTLVHTVGLQALGSILPRVPGWEAIIQSWTTEIQRKPHIFHFLIATLKKGGKNPDEVNFYNSFYLTQYIQNNTFSTWNQYKIYKIIDEIVYSLFLY